VLFVERGRLMKILLGHLRRNRRPPQEEAPQEEKVTQKEEDPSQEKAETSSSCSCSKCCEKSEKLAEHISWRIWALKPCKCF